MSCFKPSLAYKTLEAGSFRAVKSPIVATRKEFTLEDTEILVSHCQEVIIYIGSKILQKYHRVCDKLWAWKAKTKSLIG